MTFLQSPRNGIWDNHFLGCIFVSRSRDRANEVITPSKYVASNLPLSLVTYFELKIFHHRHDCIFDDPDLSYWY